MDFHEHPQLPRGFLCAGVNCGLKEVQPDLAVFYSEHPASAAAVFTRNRFPGAAVVLGREIIQAGRLRAVVVNSKISNVGTGEAGIRSAKRMAAATAAELDVPAGEVLVSSTGVIGPPLPIDRIEAGLRGIRSELGPDPLRGARAMMTTDTHPKALSVSVGDAVITWVAKGSGMIEPNLATMLVYIFTDARLDASTLDRMLRGAVDHSFNMLSVDSDSSTSDTVAVLANGLAGEVDEDEFFAAFDAGCLRVTEMLARDGEGATKLLTAVVHGAASRDDARRVAKSIINSPLVKTMAFGADPNIGRVLMAVGKCFEVDQDPGRLGIWINGSPVFRAGLATDYDEMSLRSELAGDTVEIRVDLGMGSFEATAYGCDLTHGYIDENAAYYSS